MAETEDSSKRQRLSSKERVGRNAAADQETSVARVKALGMVEVLRGVMPFVGKGHHVFLATVCKEWQEHYSAVYPSLETSLPSVVESVKRLQWATKGGYKLSVSTFKAAAEYGDVSVCEELYSMDCHWGKEGKEACNAAVRNGGHGLNVLQWLRSEDLRNNKERCPWSEYGISKEAGKCGSVEVLEWLLSDECEFSLRSSVWLGAVKAGRISALELLVQQRPTIRAEKEAADENSGWREGPYWAALEGNLEALQLLHANARELCTWDQDVCCNAVHNANSLSMLKWLRSEEVMCPWDRWVCPQALKNMHGDDGWDMPRAAFEEIKEWVHANGHPCRC